MEEADTIAAGVTNVENLRKFIENVKVQAAEVSSLTRQWPDSVESFRLIENIIADKSRQVLMLRDSHELKRLRQMEAEAVKAADNVKGLRNKVRELEVKFQNYEDKNSESRMKGLGLAKLSENLIKEHSSSDHQLSEANTNLLHIKIQNQEATSKLESLKGSEVRANAEAEEFEKRLDDLTEKIMTAENELTTVMDAEDRLINKHEEWEAEVRRYKLKLESQRKRYHRYLVKFNDKVEELNDVYNAIEEGSH